MKARISVDIEVVIHEGEPDEGGYWAEVPSLPGCVSEGDTMEEMLFNIKESIEGYLEAIPESSRGRARREATADPNAPTPRPLEASSSPTA